MRWQLTPGHDLALHYWDEECLVHHRASNDTHRVAAWVGQLLEDLREQGPQEDTQMLTSFEGLDEESLAETLEQLSLLHLIESCRT